MIQATQIRKGMTILHEKEIQLVLDQRHYTPGNKRGFVQVSLRNLKSGKITQTRFASEDRVELAVLDPRPVQYLYHDSAGFHFMDLQDYQNFPLPEALVGDDRNYLKENMEVEILCHDGKPLALQLPKVVVLKVTESPPWVKGDSVSNNMKPAVCETGLKVQVPIFIDEGTEIKVNTETGTYVSRA
ncbi:MAG: elongation factor P [Candidatus Omnitrophica bacterium]|nr:elongation factor P [Candidatus Omnitrophota bacterium]